MSAITIETRPTRTKNEQVFPHSDYRPPKIPSTPLLIDQPSQIIEIIEPEAWDELTFHKHLKAAEGKNISAVGSVAESASQAIQEGQLARLLMSITSNYEGQENIQAMGRSIVMDMYFDFLDKKGMGVSDYDAVTQSTINHPLPLNGRSFNNPIDPLYPEPRSED